MQKRRFLLAGHFCRKGARGALYCNASNDYRQRRSQRRAGQSTKGLWYFWLGKLARSGLRSLRATSAASPLPASRCACWRTGLVARPLEFMRQAAFAQNGLNLSDSFAQVTHVASQMVEEYLCHDLCLSRVCLQSERQLKGT